jgi:hypothetical protein
VTIARDQALARIIDRHLPGGHGALIVQEARRVDMAVSLAVALVEQESRGINCFGNDPVRLGQVRGGKVTRLRYARYKLMRRLRFGNQGVGLTQLTSPGYQDAADAAGGCWKPTYQLRVGFQAVTGMIIRHGEHRGLASYNAGEAGWKAGLRYADSVQARQRRWHHILITEAP